MINGKDDLVGTTCRIACAKIAGLLFYGWSRPIYTSQFGVETAKEIMKQYTIRIKTRAKVGISSEFSPEKPERFCKKKQESR